MARYMDLVKELKVLVDDFMAVHVKDRHPMVDDSKELGEAAIALGHIINLAVRCHPRGAPQHTCRRNIVEGAMKDHCDVLMNQVTDKVTQKTFWRITIVAKDS